jgi:hypothetical protein
MTVLYDAPNSFFFEPRDFLNLFAITEKLISHRVGRREQQSNLSCRAWSRDLTPIPFAIAAVLA